MYRAAQNMTPAAKLADTEGRQIDGYGFGVVDTTADPVRQALSDRAFELLEADIDPDSVHIDPRAAAAIRAARQVEERRLQLVAMDADDVHALAARHDLDADTKTEVVARLAPRLDVDLDPPADDDAGDTAGEPADPSPPPTIPEPTTTARRAPAAKKAPGGNR